MCRVMSYNISYANPDAKENIWDNRRDGVAQAILDQKIDIAGLQEVLIQQPNDLESRLEEYSCIGVARDDGKQKGEFAPLFFHKKRFKLLDSGNFWLSENPDSVGSRGWDAACVRIVTWAKLRDQKSRKTFFAFNTHFDHAGDTARIESARLLRQKISEIANDHPVVLTGDFNCRKGSAYQILIKTSEEINLKDSRYSCEKEAIGPNYSFVGSEFIGQPGNLIDHIFVSKDIRVIHSEIVENCKNGKCPSDHLPVLANIIMSKNSKH